MPTDQNTPYAAYQKYLATQCSYYFPGTDESYLAGEIVSQWHAREHLRQTMIEQQKDLDKLDGVLAGLLYAMKNKHSRLGRNGAWSGWLRQQKISRSTADRLVAEHVAYFCLEDEVPHREPGEPLEGDICLAASRTRKRLEKTLRTPKAKLTFVRALGGLFGLDVDDDGVGAVKLRVTAEDDPSLLQQPVPNVMRIMDGGEVLPVDYELTATEIF